MKTHIQTVHKKTSFMLFLVHFFMLPLSIHSQEFVSNGIRYTVVSAEKRTVEVSRDKEGREEEKYRGDIVIPSSVSDGTKTYTVTRIGDRAFAYCDHLTSVALPNSITGIGAYAFHHIPNLQKPIYNSRRFFRLPEKYKGQYVIPDGISTIAEYSFDGCSDLTGVTIPPSVKTIEEMAFNSCISLVSVAIPNSVETIGRIAFQGCTSLSSITIGPSVTAIGNSAFAYCTSLRSITIPDNVTFIGEAVFEGCENLRKAVFNSHCFAYLPQRFAGNYVISDGIEQICAGAFAGCDKLVSVRIPKSVTTIGERAFDGCTSLTSIQIPEGVTKIRSSAFMECERLRTVTIGSTVSSFGNEVFYGCSSLRSVTVASPQPVHIDEYLFEGVDTETCVLHVPAGSVQRYKSDKGWKIFRNIR